MRIDYNSIDKRAVQTVRGIESRPHASYIRYLLTKRYSPVQIKKTCGQLRLSAPHEEALTKYYLAVIDPMVKHFGLEKFYDEYKAKLTTKDSKRAPGHYMRDLLNYRLTFENEPDLQANFHEFVKFLEIDQLWMKELIEYHGSATNFPINTTGTRILKVDPRLTQYEKVLAHDKRHIVEKMLLEHIPDARIVEELQANHKAKDLTITDIRAYRMLFFNITSIDIAETIRTLEVERDSLTQFVNDLEKTSLGKNMTLGDKVQLKKQNKDRIEELSMTIRELQAKHTDATYDAATMNAITYEAIFADILLRGYDRLKKLDSDGRMDTIDGMVKMANMMKSSHDKITAIKESDVWQKGADKGADKVLIELFKQRTDEIAEEELAKTNARIAATGSIYPMDPQISANNIAGFEELGVRCEGDDGADEEE